MSDRNVQMFKYELTFELTLYASCRAGAFVIGSALLKETLDRIADVGPGVLNDERLPLAGVAGEPHREALDGWRCHFMLLRKED